jgi:hypothetical protein
MVLVLSCKLFGSAPMQSKLMVRNEILEAEGVVPDYEDGIRITDAKTLQIARVSSSIPFAARSS